MEIIGELLSHSSDETQKAAITFAQELGDRAVIGLVGPLGAGKTVFVQGLAQGLGLDPNTYVTSPTFALIHEYYKEGAASGAHTIAHFDLYRLSRFEELTDIGLDDYLNRPGICILEWAERFDELSKLLTHRIEIEILGESDRKITILDILPASP